MQTDPFALGKLRAHLPSVVAGGWPRAYIAKACLGALWEGAFQTLAHSLAS